MRVQFPIYHSLYGLAFLSDSSIMSCFVYSTTPNVVKSFHHKGFC